MSSVAPDRFFGVLSNAKYFILERLTEQCWDVLAELIATNHHQGLIGHPSFGPELLPPSAMLYIFDKLDPSGATTDEMRQRLIALACKWLDTDDEDWLSQTLTFKDITVVASKAEGSTSQMTFKALSAIHRASSRGFRRLMSLAPFVPAIQSLESSIETLRTSKEGEIAKLTQELHAAREKWANLRNTRVQRYGVCCGWLGITKTASSDNMVSYISRTKQVLCVQEGRPGG